MKSRLIVLLAIVLAVQLGTWTSKSVAAETFHSTGKSGEQSVGPVNVDPDSALPKMLSAYNLFRNARRQIPNDGVVPYDLNTPHFSDYATLHRFVWMPKGSSCHYGQDGELLYPVGSAIILTVGYLNDLRNPDQGEQIVETRLLIRRADGWEGAQYVWNEETTDAVLALAGDKVDVSWLHTNGDPREYTYRVPNKNQCIQCHEINDRFIPLGPLHARNLNKSFAYDHGEQNQLKYWSQIGYLTGLPQQADQIPSVPVWDNPTSGDLNSRARAYLDMNCSSCHRPGGIAITSGLDLRLDQLEPVRFGVFKAPVAAGRGAGIGRFVIEPGKPEESIMVIRLQSTDPGVRMPIVGRGLQHEEGVALIKRWIAEMKYPEMAGRQHALDQQVKLRWNVTEASKTNPDTRELTESR